MSRRRAARVTDWLWFGHCPTCEAYPGGQCLNQRDRLDATIRGQSALTRPHDGREKLKERIVPFLSEEARAAVPEVLAWLEAHIERGEQTWAGRGTKELADACLVVAWQLRKAATAVPTTRADPYWADRDAADA